MFRSRIGVVAPVCAAVLFLFTGAASGQATRTWVSGVGDDVNPCSRTAPCKTFAGALSKTAKNGEISVLDPGGFGTLNITKSVTIDGTGFLSSSIAAMVSGITINITDPADTAKAVRLRGLSLNGTGSGTHGIRVLAAGRVVIEETVIDGFKDGISINSAFPVQVFVKDTTIRNNSDNGIIASGKGNEAALSNVAIVFNGTGVSTSAGASIASFRNNAFFGNKTDGVPTTTIGLK